MVLRPVCLILILLLPLAACRNDIKNKEKIRQAILTRLQDHSGLDLQNLDVNTTAVTFDKNMAYATVFFHPKNDTKVNGGMTMKYTLTDRDGKWVVVNVGDSSGHGLPGNALPGSTPSSGEQLPPGHPAIDPATRPDMRMPSAPSDVKPAQVR
jgi:hypothetical protein